VAGWGARCGCACCDDRVTSRWVELEGGGVPLTPDWVAGAKEGLCLVGAAVGVAVRGVGAKVAWARGGLAYVEAADGTLAVDGALGTCRSPVRICGTVLIAIAGDARSPGMLTRFDRTGVCPASEAAGTADSAPGTARFTCRAGGPPERSVTLTP
jgi:hypothetical protein